MEKQKTNNYRKTKDVNCYEILKGTFWFITFNNRIYIYIYMVGFKLHITLSNVTPVNNLLLNSYFENSTVELHILYVLNMHTKFHVNQM